MGYQYFDSDVELALWQKKETLMKRFASALNNIIWFIALQLRSVSNPYTLT